MFFKHDDDHSDAGSFYEAWIEAYGQDKENIEINVCKMLKIDMKEAIKKANVIANQGYKLPGYDRKRMKKLRKFSI